MIDREIRAMLRGATAARVLTGWQGPHVTGRSYTITPAVGPAAERPLPWVEEFCASLTAAGVLPLYRSSEPLILP
jgi:hypothetical protein